MVGHHDSPAAAPRPPDRLGGLVWRLDRGLRWPEDALNALAAVAILFLMLLGVVQIVLRTRWLFNAPIFGYIDMIELSMPILAVLGIAYCQRQGIHIRMDILMSHLTGRVLWVVESFAAAVTLVIAILLAIFAYVFFRDALVLGGSTTDAELLTWPSKLLVPIAFALLVMRMTVQLLGAVRLARDPALAPVGVVVPKDIAEQARHEIREALGEEADR